jgi:hypothetical protein
MAEKDIIGGIFGMTPELYQAGQTQRDIAQQQAARENAGAGLFANAYAPQIQQQSQLMGRAVGGLLGVEDPQMQMVREVSQLRNQFDITTPEGMEGFAKAIAPKYPDLAMQALDKVSTLEARRSQTELRRAQADKAARGPVTSPEQLLSSGRYTPASVAQYQQTGNIADLVLVKGAGGEGGVEGPGPVGKAGAFRDVDGNILGATEMRNVRTEFTEGQKLLKLLNDATAQDIKDAESFVDWTSAGVTKGLASSKTLNAQTKLAAAQLIEQIGNLPPGSASDADMRASMKSFPGYSDPESLRQWVNRTKSKLQSRMEEISGQFGFKQRVVSSGEVKFEKQSAQKAPSSPTDAQDADSLVNKYLKPQPKPN